MREKTNDHLYSYDGKLFVKICACNHIPKTGNRAFIKAWVQDDNKDWNIGFVKNNGRDERCNTCRLFKWFILPQQEDKK